MKEIISAIVVLATVLGGGAALKSFHDTVKKAALEKVAQGMPSLSEMHKSLSKPMYRKHEERRGSSPLSGASASKSGSS